MTERIEGLVAQILNARELVLNRGDEHGVEVGMRFAILNRHGADILDPETNEVIGSVELEKTIVKVVRTQSRVSVARTFRTTRVPGGPLHIGGMSASLAAPPSQKVETLKTDEKTYEEELDEAESYVKIGDPAVEVVGEEFVE